MVVVVRLPMTGFPTIVQATAETVGAQGPQHVHEFLDFSLVQETVWWTFIQAF